MKTAVVCSAGWICLVVQLSCLATAKAELLAIGPYGADRRSVYRFDSGTGAALGRFTAQTEAFYGICQDPDGGLYVAANVLGAGDIVRFGSNGTFIGSLGCTNLHTPTGITTGPDGSIYVIGSTWPSSPPLWQVLRFDRGTGSFLEYFIPAQPDHTNAWTALGFAPNGDLYVCDSGTGILRYDGRTGQARGIVVPIGRGGLAWPSSFAFGPDGALYVSCRNSSAVLRYDANSGAYLNTLVSPGRGGLEQPGAIAFGPDGNLYVASKTGILRFRGADGEPLGMLAPAAGPPSFSALLFTSEAPRLQIRKAGDHIEVIWPQIPRQWQLLRTDSRSPGEWQTVPDAPARLQSKNVLRLPVGDSGAFFRLERN